MRPGGGDLDVVDVPAVAGAAAVGGEVNVAGRAGEAGSPAAKDVQIPSFVVVVAGAHEPAPGLQVLDRHRTAGRVHDRQAYDGVGAALDDGTRPDVH